MRPIEILLSRALMGNLPELIDAHVVGNRILFDRMCDRFAVAIMLVVDEEIQNHVESYHEHIHDWEYDDEPGKYTCASCGEVKGGK
jgi:hypothetical protein